MSAKFIPIRTVGTRWGARVRAVVFGATGVFPALFLSPATRAADSGPADGIAFFESKIRPLLIEHCLECHSIDTKQKGGLLLDSRAGWQSGGDNGPAIMPGDPEKSLLIRAVRHADRDLLMPPKNKLSDTEIAALAQWVAMGAPDPRETPVLATAKAKSEHSKPDGSKHWAFQPPVNPPVPVVRDADRVRTPVDAFLLARLEKAGLTFSPDADRATFLRRATLDLTGLPPTPEAVAAFLNDTRPDACERLIDDLLASPHYGERWGRHWLDAAGYVDGKIDNDLGTVIPHDGGWRYRDYVVQAFNDDLPFDRFLTEQIAGDELVDWRKAETFTPETLRLLTATGFLRAVDDHTDADQYGIEKRYDVLFETMDQFSTSVLALTMECTRCHDHKYDPLTQRDYYSLMACFEPALNVHAWKKPKDRFLADIPLRDRQRIDAHNAPLDKEIAELDKQVAAAKKAKDAAREKELAATIDGLKSQRLRYGVIQALWDEGRAPDSRIFVRGIVGRHGGAVTHGAPAVLQRHGDVFPEVSNARGPTTGRRLALARWLTRHSHPLTARVMVNRVWHHHFGRGIVETVGNFGLGGTPPTHPELLDWLTCEFTRQGWSLKHLHRVIMLSSAYRQSARQASPEALRADPSNHLLWRMNLRTLDAETVRDAILAASGCLNPKLGGPPVAITKPGHGLSEVDAAPGSARRLIDPKSEIVLATGPGQEFRRSLYLFARRNYPLKFLEIFDAPLMAVNSPQRSSSATVLQSLALLHSEFLLDQSDRMAKRVHGSSAGADPAARIRTAFTLALSHPPTEEEQKLALSFLTSQQTIHAASGSDAPHRALADLCHILLSSNGFIHLD